MVLLRGWRCWWEMVLLIVGKDVHEELFYWHWVKMNMGNGFTDIGWRCCFTGDCQSQAKIPKAGATAELVSSRAGSQDFSSVMTTGETVQHGEWLEGCLWGLSEEAGVLCGAVVPVWVSAVRALQVYEFQLLNELLQLLFRSESPKPLLCL